MSTTTNKEKLICLCLAYFFHTTSSIGKIRKEKAQVGKNTEYLEVDVHREEWINMIQNYVPTHAKTKYGKSLESNFDYNGISHYKSKSKTHITIVYNQVLKFYNSGIIQMSPKYKIYTQSSEFCSRIKDESSKRLKQVFEMKGNYELISPIDFFIVKSGKANDIRKKFTDNIINASPQKIFLAYEENTNTYENMLNEHFQSGDLYGISHKMSNGITSTPHVKIAGNISKYKTNNLKNIDPYSLLAISLGHMNPGQLKSTLQKIIDIEYNLFDLKEHNDSSTWRITFQFKFSQLDKSMHDVRVFLLPLPAKGSGSYNGKLQTDFSVKRTTPWIAGISPRSIQPLLSQYQEFRDMNAKMSRMMIDSFHETIGDIKKYESNPDYKRILTFLKLREFHSFARLKDAMTPLFLFIHSNDSKEANEMLDSYMLKFIEKIRNEFGTRSFNPDRIPLNKIRNHYISLQMAFYWLYGGERFREYFRKKLFFTIFGAMSKRSMGIISKDHQFVHGVRREYITRNKQKIKASLSNPIHIIIS